MDEHVLAKIVAGDESESSSVVVPLHCAGQIEGGGRIIRTGTSIPVVVYNTSLMPHPPATIQGLLTPQWTGKLATPPNASGFDVLSATDFWGQAKALDAVRKLVSLERDEKSGGYTVRIAEKPPSAKT